MRFVRVPGRSGRLVSPLWRVEVQTSLFQFPTHGEFAAARETTAINAIPKSVQERTGAEGDMDDVTCVRSILNSSWE
jgi:hypothetical protein